MTTSTLLVCVFSAIVFGGIGYWTTSLFWASEYARKNNSGDFGGPRGGVFAMGAGSLLGLMFFFYVGKYFLPAESIHPGATTATIAGLVGCIVAIVYDFKKNYKTKPTSDSLTDNNDETKK